MNVNIDPDTTPNTYIEHRELVRIGDAGTFTPRRPSRIRIGSSTGATIEGDVSTWLGGGLPPMGDRFIRDFTTRYMDPTEVYQRFDELAAEFPNISQLIPLPNRTNGYQRRAQALMSGTRPRTTTSTIPNNDESPAELLEQTQAVVLTSRAWGHEGGNDITAEFIHPGQLELAADRDDDRQRPARPARRPTRPARWRAPRRRSSRRSTRNAAGEREARGA